MDIDQYLLIKYLGGDCSFSEKEEVERWIKASEENRNAYNKLKNVWEAAEKAPDSINPDFEKAWQNIIMKTGIKDRTAKQISMKNTAGQLLKIAAGLLILFGIGWFMNKTYLKKAPIRVEAALNTGKKEIHLNDGTIIFLNHNSRILFPEKFSGHTREIRLEGEAFFNVAKDSLHPFIVHAGGTVTKVLGTSFNIKAKDLTRVQVSVLAGKVLFRAEDNPSKAVRLEKGDRGSYNLSNQEIGKSQFKDENFLAWKTGILSFDNETLGEATKVISEYYNKIIEAQPSLQNRLITVSFVNLPLDEALKILEITLDIKIDTSTEKIILEPQHNS